MPDRSIPAPARKENAKIKRDISNATWTYAGRCTVGFVKVRDVPKSLGSGTLVRFGDIVGILTCAHVLEALLVEDQIGILCFAVRARQVQTLRVSMAMTDHVVIGAPPWSKVGPDLAFLRLPAVMAGDIERTATIANGDLHRQNVVAGDPEPTRKFCVIVGVVDELTKPATIAQVGTDTVATTAFEVLINIGHVFADDESADRFRFEPVTGNGATVPTSYRGTSGGGLWKFFLDRDDFSVVQAQLIGVAYWEDLVDGPAQIVGHGPVSIYGMLFNAIREKWPLAIA